MKQDTYFNFDQNSPFKGENPLDFLLTHGRDKDIKRTPRSSFESAER